MNMPTHRHSHTLDLVITSVHSTSSPTLTYLPVSPTDHFPIVFFLSIIPSPAAPITKHLIAISSVANWVSTNFLTLKPSKTEFLVIGLAQPLSKLSSPAIRLPNNVTLLPVDSAQNLD